MDNFNVTRDQNAFLDVVPKYRCRILFTTRSQYENQISLEAKELPTDMLLVLMGQLYDAGRRIALLKEMLGLFQGIEMPGHRQLFKMAKNNVDRI